MSASGNSGGGSSSQQQLVRKVSKKKSSKSFSSSGSRRNSSLDRSVRRLKLSKALTISESTPVADVCRRMAARRTDAALLTDSSALLSGIVTDRDIAMKVVGCGLDPTTTPASMIMTKHPVFVTIDSSAVDALQKMASGKFRHLPVVDNGEVIALLDITKCLYDAITRMERAAEKGMAMAAAIEGVERKWDNVAPTPSNFVNTFRDKMFKPTLETLVSDQVSLDSVQGTDAVTVAAQKMKDKKVSSVIVVGENNKPRGILTSKDILMRVMALNLKPDETTVEKVMTPDPECVSIDTTIVDALHVMHDGKFLHLPVIDREGVAVACVDVIQLTHGALGIMHYSGSASESSGVLMQRFWDSALSLDPAELNIEDDNTSVRSSEMDVGIDRSTSRASNFQSNLNLDSTFSFKMEDSRGRIHRFNCGAESLTELSVAIAARLGSDYDTNNPPSVLYQDEEGDKVTLSCDDDLVSAVNFAKASQLKGLKIFLDFHGNHPVNKDESNFSSLPNNKGSFASGSRKDLTESDHPSSMLSNSKSSQAIINNYTLGIAAAACTAAVVAVYMKSSS